jgi:predicted ATPase/class 3 adenylate cyclase
VRNLPRGTVTFLFTDIEGSTRLLGDLGPDGYAAALAEHRTRLRAAFTAHEGVEVDTQGDAFFVAFTDAEAAATAARAAQTALLEGPIKVRMALHTGEPVVTEEGYVGVDVHRAARICATAHGGQVVLSSTTRALLGDEDTADLGLHRLKDLGEPVKLYQLGTSKFPPLRSLNATNLPAQSGLVGREADVEAITKLLRENGERLVTLTGAGGSGKTRLALQVAAELVDAFKDGVFWVSLSSVTDPALVLPAVAAELGAKVDLMEHISERRMLLLLDNLEQVLDAAPLISNLLQGCSNLRLLVTSRTPLRIQGEVEYGLAPLPIEDAVSLFQQRAGSPAAESVVAAICLRVDCLPLAVELAAARTSLFTAEDLLERLTQRLPLLTSGRRDAPERQRTLRATIEWSYELLDDEEKQLLQDTSIFAGSFEVRAAEVVADASLDTLQSLVEKSLLQRWSSRRLRMLQTIQEFASGELQQSGRHHEVRHRHASYMLELTTSANLSSESEGPQLNSLVQPEVANIRSALQGCLDNGEVELGLEILVSLEHFWVGTLPFEGVDWFQKYMERKKDLPPSLEARALRAWGGITFIVGRFEEGTTLIRKSLSIFEGIGDERGAAGVLHRLVMPLVMQQDIVRARELNSRAWEISERYGDRKGIAVSVGTQAAIEFMDGNDELGLSSLRDSAKLAEECGFLWWKAANLVSLVENLYRLKRLDEAESTCRESILLAHETEERQWLIFGLALLALISAHTNRVESAGTFWGAIETDEARSPVGQWEGERPTYLADIASFEGPEFERGRLHGRKLTLDEIVEFATTAR